MKWADSLEGLLQGMGLVCTLLHVPACAGRVVGRTVLEAFFPAAFFFPAAKLQSPPADVMLVIFAPDTLYNKFCKNSNNTESSEISTGVKKQNFENPHDPTRHLQHCFPFP